MMPICTVLTSKPIALGKENTTILKETLVPSTKSLIFRDNGAKENSISIEINSPSIQAPKEWALKPPQNETILLLRSPPTVNNVV